jgi:hypothetical protein
MKHGPQCRRLAGLLRIQKTKPVRPDAERNLQRRRLDIYFAPGSQNTIHGRILAQPVPQPARHSGTFGAKIRVRGILNLLLVLRKNPNALRVMPTARRLGFYINYGKP